MHERSKEYNKIKQGDNDQWGYKQGESYESGMAKMS